jgi:hypothetical protein
MLTMEAINAIKPPTKATSSQYCTAMEQVNNCRRKLLKFLPLAKSRGFPKKRIYLDALSGSRAFYYREISTRIAFTSQRKPQHIPDRGMLGLHIPIKSTIPRLAVMLLRGKPLTSAHHRTAHFQQREAVDALLWLRLKVPHLQVMHEV